MFTIDFAIPANGIVAGREMAEILRADLREDKWVLVKALIHAC
jgi:hypothetical protein